jgi:4-amino-4-deoxy-L-arabinose transferase-like glycosyltransferase
LVVFIVVKIPYLSLPYYWDEAWVYGPAIRIMEAHKLSLLPDALPIYYSRGHPLLFHFLGALWLRIFGTSLTASHLYALIISIALIVLVFVFCKNLFNKEVGIIACLFLVLQPIFLAQSVLVLPEVMVSLFSLVTLYFFIKEKWGWYMLSATLVLYTKETGIVAVAATGLWFLIEVLFMKRKYISLKYFILRSLILIVPLLLIGVFLLIQKKMNGWYFFPEHINYITSDKSGFADKLQAYSASLFIYWGRNVLSTALIVALFLYFFKKKHLNNKANQPILILSIYIILFLLASSFNFSSPRYIMSMIAPFMIIVAYMVFTTFTFRLDKSQDSKSNVMLRSETSRSMAYESPTSRRGIASPQCDKASWGLKLKTWGFLFAFIIAVCAVQLFIQIPTRNSSDHNLGYADCVKVHQQTVDYCLANHFQGKKIFTEFLMMGNLGNPYCGYLSEDDKFHDVSSHFDANTQLCIFYNMEGADDYKRIMASAKLHLLTRFELRQAWAEVWEVGK